MVRPALGAFPNECLLFPSLVVGIVENLQSRVVRMSYSLPVHAYPQHHCGVGRGIRGERNVRMLELAAERSR
jgi:hypothetical protein